MSFSITIHGDTFLEFTEKVVALAEQLMAAEVEHDADVPASERAPKRAPGRPRKLVTASAQPAAEAPKAEVAEVNPLDDDTPTQASPPKEVTMDDAKDAGRLVLAKKGVDVLRDVLKKFAVNKVADLKQPQFENFIKECSAITV